jgi:proteasome accessory factor B
VNLALLLASRRGVSADDVRCSGIGYPEEQETAAFLRMFERDKDALRALGLVIEVRKTDDVERYAIDAAASFTRPIDLSAEERAAIRTVAASLASDAGFPFGEDLVIALGKLGASVEPADGESARLVDEAPAEQAAAARAFAAAIQACKTVAFTYTNSRGECRGRVVDPYGTFFNAGRWYVAGRDHGHDEVRVFALVRASAIEPNTTSPHTPDFERPDGFSIGDHALLSFEYGAGAQEAVVRVAPEVAWRAERATRGRGTLTADADGSAVWRVPIGDTRTLASWLIAEGPGWVPVAPQALVDSMRSGLEEVLSSHGSG